MQRHELLKRLVLKKLKAAPGGLSALALLCQCRGYRHVHKKLLYFSVQERALIQAQQIEKAELLLKKVLSEADMYYGVHAEEYEAREAKRRKSQAKLKDYDLVEPPREVVIQPAGKRLVSGNPNYSEEVWESRAPISFGIGFEQMVRGLAVGPRDLLRSQLGAIAATSGTVSPAQLKQMVADGVITEDQLPEALRPPVYEAVPELHGPSPYAIVEEELEDKLRRYPKVVWQKIETERNLVDNDAGIDREVRRQRQATNRAIDALMESGQVVSNGKRVNTLYSLANDGA